MHPLTLIPLVSTRSALEAPSTMQDCPTSTVEPDANGWVPPGTCGYISRPYYPSFVAALVFCAAATLVLLGYALLVFRLASRRRDPPREGSGSLWKTRRLLPWFGVLISLCLLAAYILRAFGTRYQQVPEFVAFSDTLVLLCPILVFALDCIALTATMSALFPGEKLFGITERTLSRGLYIVILLLAIEQLIASALIAPKHPSSPSRRGSNTAMLGVKLYLFGIGVQEVFVVCTFGLALMLHSKLSLTEARKARTTKDKDCDLPPRRWCLPTIVLLISLGAITTRIAYRLVELSGIFTGRLLFLMHNEVFFYTLECLPVLLALGIWTIVNTEELLDHSQPESLFVDAYSYHEISEESDDDDLIPLRRVDVT